MQEKILVIDDDRDFLEAVSLILSQEGYLVSTALNGKEGFAKAREEYPDLIILDIKMDYEDEGIEIAKSLSSDASLMGIPLHTWLKYPQFRLSLSCRKPYHQSSLPVPTHNNPNILLHPNEKAHL